MHKRQVLASAIGVSLIALTLAILSYATYLAPPARDSQLAQVVGAGVPADIIEQTRLLRQGAGLYDAANPNQRAELARSMVDLAKSRRDDLLSQVLDNPSYVFENAIPEGIRSLLPPQARPYIEETTSVTGEVSVVHVDYFTEDGEPDGFFRYMLTTPKGKTIALSFVHNPPGLISGAQVHARGILIEGPLSDEVTTMDGAMALMDGTDAVVMYAGEEAAAGEVTNGRIFDEPRPGTFGEQRTLVLLALASDVSVPPHTKEYMHDHFFGTTSAFFLENSYGQAWLTGDTADWVNVPWTSAECPKFRDMHTNLVEQAQANGIDTSQYSRHVIFAADQPCFFAGIATIGLENSTFDNTSVSWMSGHHDDGVQNHEIGHNFGLPHSSSYYCWGTTNETFGSLADCPHLEYGDWFDTMGSSNNYSHFNPAQKERLGWLDYGTSPLIQDVSTDGIYTIKPYETETADVKALRIHRYTKTNGDEDYFYYNFMRPIGFDKIISDNYSEYEEWKCRGNVLDRVFGRIQTIPASETGFYSNSHIIHLDPQDCWYDFVGNLDREDPGLPLGKSVYDPYSGITVGLESFDDSGAEVSVAFGEPVCIEGDPALSWRLTSGGAIPPGGGQLWSFWASNGDTPACVDRDFRVTLTDAPAGWWADPDPYLTTIDGGVEEIFSVTIYTSPDTISGTYPFTLTLTDVNDPTISVSETRTMTVDDTLPPPSENDTTPPTVTITEPADGTTVAKGSTITISANASDNVGVTSVELYAAGSLVCTDTTAPYSCSWSVPKGKSRTFGIHAEAYDEAGNLGFAPTVFVSSGGEKGGGSGKPGGSGGGDKCTPGAKKKGEC